MKIIYLLFIVLLIFACDDESKTVNNQGIPENCSDGLDNDLDSWIDCWDSDCQGDDACKQGTETCGNGIKEENEYCDMHDFGGETCFSHGYSAGELYCTSQCSISLSACTTCGNGICEFGETYVDCAMDCDSSQLAVCGNAIVESGEECDGQNLDSKNCLSLAAGYTGGMLRCSANCIFDYSACEYCGNHICEALETAETCLIDCSMGTSVCGNGICESDESSVTCPNDCEVVCGNYIIEAGEECDSVNVNAETCNSLGHTDGLLTCNSNCTFNETGCWTCGDGVCDSAAGESLNNCFSDCPSSCLSGDVIVSVPLASILSIYGTTGYCGNHPHSWGDYMDLVGDEMLFNVSASGTWLVWYAGSSCTTDNLRWDLVDVTIVEGNNGMCWAMCNPSGPHICCSYSGQLPALCGDGNDDMIYINADQRLD